jgi:hypothetical protein
MRRREARGNVRRGAQAWFSGALCLAMLAGCDDGSSAPSTAASAATPGATLQKVTVRASFGGKLSPARLHLKRGPEPWLPESALIAFRDNLVFEGQAEFEAPAGEYPYELERGPTFRPIRGTLVVAEGKAAAIDASFERLVDPEALGWFAGDLHNHRSAADTPELMRTEVLHVAPVVTWWNGMMKYDASQAEVRLLPDGPVLDQTGGEDERVGGALMFFRLKQPLKLPPPLMDGKRYLHLHGDPRCELPTAASLAREAHGVPGAHISLEKPFWWDGPTHVALGLVDSFQLAHNHMRRQAPSNREAWGRECDKKRFPHPVFGNGECSVDIYYQFLEAGFHLPPSAGSASGVHLNPLGYDRVYVHTGAFDYDAWWSGLAQGRSFVTNGPLLFVRINQQLPGHTFRISSGESLELEFDVQIYSNEKLASVELVQNAKVVAQGRLDDDGRVRFGPTRLVEGGWFLIRARTVEPRTFQFASTAPFYVEVAGAERRISRSATEFFESWVSARIAQIRKGGADQPLLDEMLAPQLEALEVYKKLGARATAP